MKNNSLLLESREEKQKKSTFDIMSVDECKQKDIRVDRATSKELIDGIELRLLKEIFLFNCSAKASLSHEYEQKLPAISLQQAALLAGAYVLPCFK